MSGARTSDARTSDARTSGAQTPWAPWIRPRAGTWPDLPVSPEDRAIARYVEWCVDEAVADDDFLREVERVFHAKHVLRTGGAAVINPY